MGLKEIVILHGGYLSRFTLVFLKAAWQLDPMPNLKGGEEEVAQWVGVLRLLPFRGKVAMSSPLILAVSWVVLTAISSR